MTWWSWASVRFLGYLFTFFADRWSCSSLPSGTVGNPDKQPGCCSSSPTHRWGCVFLSWAILSSTREGGSFPSCRISFVGVLSIASDLPPFAILGCSWLLRFQTIRWFRLIDCKKLGLLFGGFSFGDARCASLDGFFKLRRAVKKSFANEGALWVAGFRRFV